MQKKREGKREREGEREKKERLSTYFVTSFLFSNCWSHRSSVDGTGISPFCGYGHRNDDPTRSTTGTPIDPSKNGISFDRFLLLIHSSSKTDTDQYAINEISQSGTGCDFCYIYCKAPIFSDTSGNSNTFYSSSHSFEKKPLMYFYWVLEKWKSISR